MKQHVWEAVQFLFVDGIDGPETHKVAEYIGLSQNYPHSVIWEIQTLGGWKCVDHGDWILSKNSDFSGEKVYTVVGRLEFDRDMEIFPPEEDYDERYD